MTDTVQDLIAARIVADNHAASDYFAAIKDLVRERGTASTN